MTATTVTFALKQRGGGLGFRSESQVDRHRESG